MIRKHFRLKRIALGLALATAVVAPTAQAAVYVDGPTPGVQAGYIRAAAYQLKVEGMRWQAMAKQYESRPGITAAGAMLANQKHSALPVPVSQLNPVSQLKVEGMRWMAMANQYKNQPGITAAGAALANQKHTALPVPITQASDDVSVGRRVQLERRRHRRLGLLRRSALAAHRGRARAAIPVSRTGKRLALRQEGDDVNGPGRARSAL